MAKLDRDRKRRSKERDRSRKQSVAARKKRERERKKQVRESNKKAAKKRKERVAKVTKAVGSFAGGVNHKSSVSGASRKISNTVRVNKVARGIRAKNPSMSEGKSRRLARQVIRAENKNRDTANAIASFTKSFNSAMRGGTIEGGIKKLAKVNLAQVEAEAEAEQDAKNSDFESRYTLAASGEQKWVNASGFGESAAEAKAKFMLFNKMHSDISHNVRPEDRLSAIAKAHGTTDFQTAWDETMDTIDPQLLQDTIDRVQYAMDHGEDPSEAAMLELATAYSSSIWNGME